VLEELLRAGQVAALHRLHSEPSDGLDGASDRARRVTFGQLRLAGYIA
jgi:hypothetical protein